jgi:NAD(P)-dependent dehydrogenase (short-subunit alcohol dehydrogenase family)
MVAKMMREQGGGNIINMSSVAGIKPSRLYIYSITKAAIIKMTEAMARDFGQYNIRVNAIAPGVIMTRFSEFLWKTPEAGENVKKHNSLSMIGKPEDVAGAALYLASDASRYVTGATIVVDGGEK